MADLSEFQRRFDGYVQQGEPPPQVYAPHVPSPEDAAMGVEAEAELGVPAAAAAGLPYYKTLLQEGRVRRDLEGTSVLPEFLRDPVNAGLARDDTEPLSGLERLGREMADRNVKAASALARGGLDIAAGVEKRIAAGRMDTVQDVGKTLQEIALSIEPHIFDKNPPEPLGGAYRQHVMEAAKLRFQNAYLGHAPRDAGEVERRQAEIARGARGSIEAAGALRRIGEGLPRFEAAERMREQLRPAMEAEGFTTQLALMMQAFAGNPQDAAVFLGSTFLESAPTLLAATATTLLTKSPAAGIAVMGAGSATAEFSGEVEDFLQANGIDISTPEGVDKVFANPAIWQEAQRKGVTKGLIVALFDVASGGVAGQMLVKSPVGNVILQLVVQAFAGGGGDAVSDLAIGKTPNAVNVMLEALLETVTLPSDLVIAGRTLRKDTARAARAGETRATLERIDERVAASKLRARAPARFKAFMELAGSDAFLNVPAEDLQTFFQAKDTTFGPDDLGIDPVAYEDALATGEDVQIPAAVYADRISGTPAAEWFHENSTFDEDGMTGAEAQAFNDRVGEIRQDEAEEQARQYQERLDERASDVQVYDGVFSQLRAANMSPDAADQAATAWQAFFRSQADRYGEDSLDLARQFGFRIEGPEQQQARRRKDTRDVALNTLRSRKKPASREGLSESEAAGETALDELAAELGRRGIDINALTNDEIVAAIEGKDGETLAQVDTPPPAPDILATDGPWRDAEITAHDEDGAEITVPAGANVDILQERITAARELLECVNAG